MCAYLTQMLKLSYTVQYRRKLRRMDGPARKWSPLLRLYVCTRIHILYTIQPISGKSHNIPPRRMRREAERRNGKERKLSLNSQTLRSQQFCIAHITRDTATIAMLISVEWELYTALLYHHTTTYVDSNPSTFHSRI